ncbi:MAG: hypothetical protein ACJ8ER_15135 [Allosphingosinicella sp.]
MGRPRRARPREGGLTPRYCGKIEFFNYPGWRNHEYKAFMELVEARGLKFRYHSLFRRHPAVCVVIA